VIAYNEPDSPGRRQCEDSRPTSTDPEKIALVLAPCFSGKCVSLGSPRTGAGSQVADSGSWGKASQPSELSRARPAPTALASIC